MIKKAILFIFFGNFIFSCGQQKIRISKNANISLMRKEFRKALYLKDLDRAASFAIYFTNSTLDEDHIHLTQFYILACSPVKAYEHLQLIKKKSLVKDKLEATLGALVTTGIQNEESILDEIKASGEIVRYKIDATEVWRDEWELIRLKKQTCRVYPQLTQGRRKYYQKEARKMFIELGEPFLLIDFSLVAMAMELKVEFKNINQILEKFKEYSGNVYYRRLEKIMKSKKSSNEKAESIVSADIISPNEIRIKGMSFFKIVKPKSSWVPLVIEEKDFVSL